MKLFGHPLHLMLIHFPAALLPMDLVCSVLRHYTGDPAFVSASFFAMSGGVVLGWLAMLTGAFDLISVRDKNPGALNTALLHGGINGTVIIVYTVFALISLKQYPTLIPDSLLLTGLKAAVIVLMLAGNYLGGSLILKHHVAIDE